MTTWVQFSSGRGPAECRLAVRGLSVIFGRDVGATLLEAEEDRDGQGWLSALMATDADEALVRPWLGTLEWVCPSPLRTGHKRKRWFVGVTAFLPPDMTDVRLRPSDLRWEAMRASGPGGQHVNTTDSAVRLVHLSTGTVVTAREERSQHRNRSLALARLLAALEGRAEAVTAGVTRDRRDAHDALERGNPVMSFEGLEFRRRG